jgi:hypothetical protein
VSDATHQKGDEPIRDATISGLIFDAMYAHVAGPIGKVFTEYVDRHRTDKWLLFSDYVLGDRNRPNEVIALTVVPGGDYWASLLRDFRKIAKSDFKNVRTVSSSMIELLSDPRLFSFCWLLEPRRALTRNVAVVRGMLDRDIARVNGRPDVALRTNELGRLKALRRKAESPGFNIRLFDNMLIAAALAAFVTYLICRSRRATRVGWFSDRDSITVAHDAFAHHLYAINVAQFSGKLQPEWRGPDLGVNAPSQTGEFWSDPFLRVPDHFAGLLSAWDFEQDTIPAKPGKYRQVLEEGVASHPNVYVMRLFFRHRNDLVSAEVQSLGIARRSVPSI